MNCHHLPLTFDKRTSLIQDGFDVLSPQMILKVSLSLHGLLDHPPSDIYEISAESQMNFTCHFILNL